MIRFWKALGSTSIFCKKICKFAKFQIFIAISSYKAKNAQNKNVQIAKNYTFVKNPWPSEFKLAKIFAKLWKPKCVLKKNWKCANFL